MIFDRKTWKKEAKVLVKTGKTSPLAVTGVLVAISLGFAVAGYMLPESMFVSILQTLLTPVITIGYIMYLMGIRRGEEMPLVTLFDGFKNTGKSLWIMIRMYLRIAVYFFAGSFIGSTVLSLLLNIFMSDKMEALSTLALQYLTEADTMTEEAMIAMMPELWPIFLISGFVMLCGCVAAAYAGYKYRYTAHNYCKNPTLSPRECLRISAIQTKGHKGKLFVLDLTFLGWFLLGILTFGILLIWVMPYYMETDLAYFEACQKDIVLPEAPQIEE